MADRSRVELGEIQETLLIPLYGRAIEARRRRPLLRDPVAVEIVDSLDYDFAKFDRNGMRGPVLRTTIFDEWVRGFLNAHPEGTVVEIGSGLNTRFERLDNGRLHWVDLDLPDVVRVRRRFFADSDRRRTIAASVLDVDWLDAVAELPGPYLFLAEAVLMYLPEADVRRALGRIAGRFPGARIALDTAGPDLLASQGRDDALSTMTARISWACSDPTLLESAGLRLLASRAVSRPPATAPLRYRLLLPLLGALPGSPGHGYRLNLYAGAPARG